MTDRAEEKTAAMTMLEERASLVAEIKALRSGIRSLGVRAYNAAYNLNQAETTLSTAECARVFEGIELHARALLKEPGQ